MSGAQGGTSEEGPPFPVPQPPPGTVGAFFAVLRSYGEDVSRAENMSETVRVKAALIMQP
jgi:hypothetical protein